LIFENKSLSFKLSLNNSPMKHLIIAFFLLLPFSFLKSQINQDWAARFNGPAHSDDRPNSVAIDANGNVFVTGGGEVINPDVWGMTTIKYNSAGVQQWAVTFTGTSTTVEGRVIACDAAGNVYVTGNFNATGTGVNYVTIKYNTNGVQQWVSYYVPPAGSRIPRAMVLDDSANVYVTGISTVKYNTNGVQQWAVNHNTIVNAITIDPARNIYLAGGVANDTCRTFKYNSNGVLQWAAKYPSKSFGSSVAIDGSGNVYTAGYLNAASSHDFLILKYNPAGVQQWMNSYNNPANNLDEAKFIKIDLSGNVIVSGNSSSSNKNYFTTIKYNSSGFRQWVTGDSSGRFCNGMVLDSADNIYITGEGSTPSTSLDFMTVKYNASGVQQWAMRFDAAGGGDHPSDIKIDRSGNVYVVGIADSSAGNGYYDYATLKYSQGITGISVTSNTTPSNFDLMQNYPNPFNPTTNIEFALPEKSFVKLKVFDFLGREVSELVNENLTAGSYRYNFNGANLSSGMYLYKLETENFSETKKMMLVK